MSVEVRFVSQTTIVETSEGEFVSASDNTITVDGMNTVENLDSTTTPPVTKHSAFALALSGGAATIDLTSLPDDDGVAAAVDFTGLKVQVAKFANPVGNAAMTITLGASNGHPLFTADGIVLQGGEEWTFKGYDAGTDVAAGDATWDVTGTGTEELNVLLVAG